MSTETKIKWGSGRSLPDGHRLFFNTAPHDSEYKAAIADDSGRFPEDTDDGILWLDFSRTLDVRSGDEQERESIAIPLIRADGSQTRTPTDAATMLHLSREFRWTIGVDNAFFYNVR